MAKSALNWSSKLGRAAIKAAGKTTLGGKIFGVGAANQAKGKILKAGQKIARGTAKAAPALAAYSGASALLGDSGPADTFMSDDFSERAMNQLKYNLDMTNDELEAHLEAGNSIQETGLIGEGGLSEQEALKYIKENSDHREGWQKARDRIVDVAGLFNPITAGAAIYNDSRLGKERVQNLNNVVGKLRADANEGEIRRNMEGTMGKFMAEGILDKDFGRGKVRTSGGIKPAEDRAAKAEEAAALKEYEAIKAKDGIFAALQSPAAMKAGRQVYLDVQEASGGDKNTAEALLSGVGGQEGVGLTDQETMEKYYGNPEKNALANEATAAKAALAAAKAQSESEAKSPEAVAQAEFVRDSNRSGPIDLPEAKDQQGVINNQAAIAQHRGFYGQSPEAVKQQAYLNANNMKTARQFEDGLQNDPRWADLMKSHMAKMSAQAKARSEYIAPQHRMGVDPNGQAARDKEAARIFGGNPAPAPTPSVPAQVNAAADGIGPDKVVPTPIKVPSGGVREGPPPLPPQRMPAPEPAPSNVMKPTPYGVGTATPGFPKLPDIGAPVRNFVENATTIKNSPGAPMPGMKPTPYGLGTGTPGMPQLPDIGGPARNAGERIGNLIFGTNAPGNPAPNMKPTPYGLGSGTAGMPQVPDIGAPVRNAVEGALTTKSSAPGQMPKAPMSPTQIAEQIIAEQKRKEIEARNAQMPRNPGKTRPNPMKPFY